MSGQMIECDTHPLPEDWYQSPVRKVQHSWGALKQKPGHGIYYRDRHQWVRVRIRFRPSLFLQDRATELQFQALAQEWRREARFASSPDRMFLLPSYQRIIGMGPKVVPFILRDLRRAQDHWFWALAAITGENPVTPDRAGNVRAMTAAWLEWGRQQGYL